ncbi:hypothetical protein [Christiangramia sp. SM2212]|uniref:Uncharacterized protein n=1 Tax=Christiangramia sediminicola TaxID=3073267 RepID=A0ABU1EPF0_9FLAO|nr:hypothetical protein [Christiangramia sp. SM2212]MDR5590260.1 hypothetical protein [Christiangramia sp. SM2212]
MSVLGYFKVKNKGGSIPDPISVNEDTYITAQMNNVTIRVKSDCTLLFTAELPSNFTLKIVVYGGCQCRLIGEGVTVTGYEGNLIPEHTSCTVFRDEDTGDFNVIRDQPVIDYNYYRLFSTNSEDINYIALNLERNHLLRIKEGTALIYEKTNEAHHMSAGVDLSEIKSALDKEATFWATDNRVIRLNQSTNQNLFAIYFDNWNFDAFDFDSIIQIGYTEFIYGMENIPHNLKWRINYGSVPLIQQLLNTIDFKELSLTYGINQNYEPVNVIAKQNLELFKTNSYPRDRSLDFVVKDCPNLSHLELDHNRNVNAVKSLDVQNCPSLNYVRLNNFYARYGSQYAPAKNVDQLLTDLDNNGIENGYLELTEDYQWTATGQAALDNLIAKGWDTSNIIQYA